MLCNLCQPVFKRLFHVLILCLRDSLHVLKSSPRSASWLPFQNMRKYCNHKAGRSLRWKATGDGGLYQFVFLEATMQSFHTPGAVTHNTIVKGALFMEPKPRSNKQENGADYGARLFLWGLCHFILKVKWISKGDVWTERRGGGGEAKFLVWLLLKICLSLYMRWA